MGCGFVLSGNPVRFVGWESELIAKMTLAPYCSTLLRTLTVFRVSFRGASTLKCRRPVRQS